MKITLDCAQGDSSVACIASGCEADLDKAFRLLEELLDSRGHLYLQTESFCVEFQDLSDTSFEVEIYDLRDGFWAISEVGILAARKITEMVSENKKFGTNIPTTDQIWGAYGGGEFS